MRRRSLFRFDFCLFLSIAGSVVALWLTRPVDRVTWDSYKNLQLGMSRQQVEEILGGRPGDYGTGEILPDSSAARLIAAERDVWVGQRAAVYLKFDEKDQATLSVYLGEVPRAETLTHKVRRWLGLATE